MKVKNFEGKTWEAEVREQNGWPVLYVDGKPYVRHDYGRCWLDWPNKDIGVGALVEATRGELDRLTVADYYLPYFDGEEHDRHHLHFTLAPSFLTGMPNEEKLDVLEHNHDLFWDDWKKLQEVTERKRNECPMCHGTGVVKKS